MTQFHQEETLAYIAIFREKFYFLYCSVFEGEVNEGGFTDFCDNIILAGQEFYERMLGNPDHFVEINDIVPFNDESYLGVVRITERIIEERYGRDIPVHTSEALVIYDPGVSRENLKAEVGTLTFAPQWEYIRLKMPNIYAKYHYA